MIYMKQKIYLQKSVSMCPHYNLCEESNFTGRRMIRDNVEKIEVKYYNIAREIYFLSFNRVREVGFF